jgi:hypothetical protein
MLADTVTRWEKMPNSGKKKPKQLLNKKGQNIKIEVQFESSKPQTSIYLPYHIWKLHIRVKNIKRYSSKSNPKT